MKLSEMRDLLATRGIQLTKSLGQNFLHDANQLRRIVEAAELAKTDKVLEVGPGLGPLTELLLMSAAEVFAIEKDARLVEVLRKRFRGNSEGRVSRAPNSANAKDQGLAELAPPVFTLLHADALDFLKREPRDWSDWKLVANLPYSVASPILVELAQSHHPPERMVATLQLEVAQRLMAGAGDENYGILTLLVRLDYEPRDWFKIPAGCFFPAPDVDSACVVLIRRAQPLLPANQREAFVKIVKRAFSQRRKMMLKLLKQDWPEQKLKQIFQELCISPQERAEKLTLEQFAAFTKMLTSDK
ncbi:MAG: 16S rRNA (adenine(1518)-N(6)/adenine(1519)-N(6))-dimethyltransferase RsmA [Verrucomicrobiia bacterium]